MLVQAGAAGYPASSAVKSVGMGGPGPAGAGAGDKAGGKRGRAEMEKGPKKSALAPGLTAQGQPRKVARKKNAGAEAGMGMVMVGGVGAAGMGPMGPGGYPMGGKVRPALPCCALLGSAWCCPARCCAAVVWCGVICCTLRL